mmetsp:Transcript_14987/g.22064  ORF Transcript_14987/g.22064 Transcript_14987/m.22064 type:complete len:387 (-) Transcript_14987:49-1209(-)
MEDPLAVNNVLHGDLLCSTLRYLEYKDALIVRLVASSWKDAVMETLVEEQVYVKTQKTLQGLCLCLPNLLSLLFDQKSEVMLENREEEEPMLYRCSKIQHFQCLHTTPSLIESYDIRQLLAHWQNLQSLNLHGNEDLEWNISDLASLRHLKDIRCINNRCLHGDTQDLLLRHDRGSENKNYSQTSIFQNLSVLDMSGCIQVTGKLRDFRKLPNLIWLGINRTQVRGDLRHDIIPGDFVALQGIGLCSQAVYGANQIQSVQDADSVMRARLQIMQQSTWESPIFPLMVHLSPDSPDHHVRIEQMLYRSERDPPFNIEIVVVGTRWGWRWSNYLGGFCETHWLGDPPRDCEDYNKEIIEFEREQPLFYQFLDPPTREQYQALCREWCW